MSVIEVHPEELLDRELRGELTERERVLLSAHLQRCAPCRLERRLRADFEREHALRLPASDLTDVIAGALRACELPGASAASPSEAVAPRARGAMWRRAAMLLVACTVLGVGVGYAGAQLGLAEGSLSALLERVGMRVSARPPARSTRARSEDAPKRGATPEATALAAPSAQPTPIVSAPEPAPRPALLPAPKRHVRAHARRPAVAARPAPTALAPSIAVAPAASSELSPVVSSDRATSIVVSASTQSATTQHDATHSSLQAAPPDSPSRLFERANRARHRGAHGEASELYDDLRSRFPDSAEARLSVAVSARMQLDQGELRAALSGFDTYLAGSDRALHEEAMVGRIRALDRLGREREARAAAESLLRAHPGTAFRPDAEALIARSERD